MYVIYAYMYNRVYQLSTQNMCVHVCQNTYLALSNITTYQYTSLFRRAHPRLGDLMTELFPLLSAYTPYVEHFNNAMASMTLWTEKCPIFNRLVMEVEVRCWCIVHDLYT